jgi:hypothetical protein
MVPGVSSGDLGESRRFLDRIRMQGKYEVAAFYDWEPGDLSRKVVSPTAVRPAARRLIRLCETFQNRMNKGRPVDLLAHSAGTVVVNNAATTIAEAGSPVRFRHVLLLGTALKAEEPLQNLKAVSAGVLNVHSASDKVNRNINRRMGRLSALEGGSYRNLRMDRSLGGRIVRHHVFLSSNPENWRQYGTFLATGQWPTPNPALPVEDHPVDDLHGLTLWVGQQPDEADHSVREMLPNWLSHSDPEVVYYAVALAGILKAKSLGPTMKTLLADKRRPVYLRKEIYQALGNFEDGAYIDFLRSARKRDRACDEVIRDVLRALKRKRVESIR